jgi:hypothetical protein
MTSANGKRAGESVRFGKLSAHDSVRSHFCITYLVSTHIMISGQSLALRLVESEYR